MKKYCAEFIGTFWLVLGGCGSAVLAAAFPEVGIGLLGVALAFGLTVLTMAFAIGHISGCHLNPAVSFGLWAGGRFPAKDLLPYIIAQVLGGIVAGGVLYLIATGKAGFDVTAGFASNGFGEHSPGGYSMLAALLCEVVMTMMFLIVIMGATDKRAPQGLAPIAIGFCLTLIHLISIPVTNTSVNPARSTGVAVYVGGWATSQLWLFWVAPIIGAIIGALIYRFIISGKELDWERFYRGCHSNYMGPPNCIMFLTKQIIKAALFISILAALLFGVSGKISWAGGWLYLAVFSVCSIISTIIMVRRNPELLQERMQPGSNAKSWDRILAPLMAGVCPALIVVAAALEVRLGSASPFPFVFVAAAILAAVAGHALMTWAMMRNDFFSALVRIQRDRGHQVTTQGPYRFVRHPGYVGMLIFAVATPFILGSSWALVPAAANLCVGILRTMLEDRTLRLELDGYVDYASTVPYRLLPGIW